MSNLDVTDGLRTSGDDVDLTLETVAAARIVGTVKYADGAGVEGAFVAARWSSTNRFMELSWEAYGYDEAATRYRRILEIDPGDAGAITKIGVLRMRAGAAEEAIALFRKAVEREPMNGEALLYLAGALASTGRPAEALPYFERTLFAGPRSSMAWASSESGAAWR